MFRKQWSNCEHVRQIVRSLIFQYVQDAVPGILAEETDLGVSASGLVASVPEGIPGAGESRARGPF
eukprot:24864-Alexandrium_andersonii.AAC.1